jgi:hypothetical protein
MAEDWSVNFPVGGLIDNKIAGIDWLQGCSKRHKKLTLHKHENKVFRANAFNTPKIMGFIDNYERALKS